MKSYELVLMLNVSVAEADRKKFLTELESKFTVLDKDEIGLKEITFTLKGGAKQAYFVSYHLELTPVQIAEVKQYLLYNPNLIRYEIFSKDAGQEFFHFEKLNKSFEKAIEEIKDKRYGNKLSFFTKKENEKYLHRKSVDILRYYLTRFGDIKPRIYTGNSVKVQKKLRTAIIRARSLGVLSFINK
jgi:ribosomal protein S18/ribosomal protein S6